MLNYVNVMDLQHANNLLNTIFHHLKLTNELNLPEVFENIIESCMSPFLTDKNKQTFLTVVIDLNHMRSLLKTLNMFQ